MNPRSASSSLTSLASRTPTQAELDILAIFKSYNRCTNLDVSRMQSITCAPVSCSQSQTADHGALIRDLGPVFKFPLLFHHPYNSSNSCWFFKVFCNPPPILVPTAAALGQLWSHLKFHKTNYLICKAPPQCQNVMSFNIVLPSHIW